MPEHKKEHHHEHPKHHDHPSENELTIIEWSAPGRPFKKRAKQFFLTSLLIMLLVEVILFLFSEYLLMVAVVSLVFLAFALSIVPPKDFNYRISSEGIQIEDRFFIWKELYDFYFIKNTQEETLQVRTEDYFPGELTITFAPENKETIKNALIAYLPFREYVKPTFMEKAARWLSRNFPLDNN